MALWKRFRDFMCYMKISRDYQILKRNFWKENRRRKFGNKSRMDERLLLMNQNDVLCLFSSIYLIFIMFAGNKCLHSNRFFFFNHDWWSKRKCLVEVKYEVESTVRRVCSSFIAFNYIDTRLFSLNQEANETISGSFRHFEASPEILLLNCARSQYNNNNN